jgi:hypothetical protein
MPDESWRQLLKLKLEELRRIPYWTMLRATGNSPPVKLTILIPVIGYAIIFNEKIIQYLQISENILNVQNILREPDILHSPVSWRLLCLYFGLCLVAFASIIYAVWCPTLIKKYASATEFVANDSPHIAFFTFKIIEDEFKSSTYKNDFKIIKDNGNYEMINRRTEDSEEAIIRKYDKELLSLYFVFLNQKNLFCRRLASSLYLLGFGATAIPSIDIFGRVSFLLYRAVWPL